MTTNEDATALIAEAREHWVELNGLNSRAAEVLLQIADRLAAVSDTPQEIGKRLIPEFRASLIDAAAQAIQDVWNDVPDGVDAVTLAGNVVLAQEFFWLSRAFPVHAVSDTTPGDRAMQIAQAIAKAHTFSTPTALSIADVALALAAPQALSEDLIDRAVDAGIDLIAWDMFEDERVPEDAETAIRGAIQHLITNASLAPTPSEGEREAVIDAVLTRLDEMNNGEINYEVYSELHDLVSAIPPAPARDEWEESTARDTLKQIERYLERFGPYDMHSQRVMAEALREIIAGEKVAWAPSDDKPMPVTEEER